MTDRNYYSEEDPFSYRDGDPVEPGMDCLQLRQPAGPFHYLISEQAKSLVALQELQHEVGALLEFRDLVMETFPNLRTKLAASTPATMTSHHHHHHHPNSNIPVSIRPGDWTPGIRVRKKIGSKDEGRSKKGDIAVQDSGFSTETSSKETHSASSTVPPPSSTATGAADTDEVEDELWNLLDIIHRKGSRLKHEAEALQGTIRQQGERDGAFHKENDGTFQRALFHSSPDDARQLRQERDQLLDRLAEMEAEVLAGRVHTSRLQEDLESLLSAKQDLEEQLKAVVTQRGEVNSRIHDLHLQFVTKSGSTDSEKINRFSVGERRDSSSSSSSQITNRKSVVSELDSVLGDKLPKVSTVADSKKISAILKEHDPLVLQKHLLSSTVQNQVFQEQLDSAISLEVELRDKLDKFKEENEDLRFQLQDKSIELEGTRARVRLLEDLQKPLNKSSSPDIIPVTLDTTPPGRPPSRTEISTASMKAMSPLTLSSLKAVALNMDLSSSTESAHDQSAEKERRDSAGKSRRPSKIPLKNHTAPKPPQGKHSPAPGTRNRSSVSPGRPHSAQSWRNKSEGNSLSGSKSNTSLSKSRNSSLVSAKDSLSSKLRNSDSLMKLAPPVPRGGTLKKTSTPIKKESSSVSEKISNSNSARERSQSPWILSSFNSDREAAYPDSLDKNDSIQQSITDNSGSHRFQTANTFLWTAGNARDNIEFYDSIDTNMASSLFHVNGEDLAECDSLERHLSDFSDKK
ncbi:javelin-like isoform X1 [Leptinotarsa decemlineata]|uniref:javelin-like isoform X1 n=2 Tax=Leptinotarsa decemlineata TaxID=7539 RepID=UPI003D30D7A7